MCWSVRGIRLSDVIGVVDCYLRAERPRSVRIFPPLLLPLKGSRWIIMMKQQQTAVQSWDFFFFSFFFFCKSLSNASLVSSGTLLFSLISRCYRARAPRLSTALHGFHVYRDSNLSPPPHHVITISLNEKYSSDSPSNRQQVFSSFLKRKKKLKGEGYLIQQKGRNMRALRDVDSIGI